MELEPSFFRLHVRVLDTYTRLVGPSTRQSLENATLAVACILLAILVHLVCCSLQYCLRAIQSLHGSPLQHLSFVGHPGCAQALLEDVPLGGVHVVRLEVKGPLHSMSVWGNGHCP